MARYLLLVGLVVFSLLLLTANAGATVYTGSLQYENLGAVDTGLEVVSANDDGWKYYTKIDWTVSDEVSSSPTGFPIYYEYVVTVRKYELSYLIIEASAGFDSSDMTQVKENGLDLSTVLIETHNIGPSAPDMPEPIYGIKFDDLGGGVEEGGGNVTHTISFFSNRLPVWGDAYLKCGGYGNRAWNEGFTSSDSDPISAPTNGSVDMHLLVPDSVVPEPATFSLLAVGGLALIRRRRK